MGDRAAASLRRHGPAALLALGLGLLSVRPLWTPGQVYGYRDHLAYFLPMRLLAAESVRAGEWPWRNPYVACGNPFFANPETQLLYPPAWGFLALGLHGGSLFFFGGHAALGAFGASLLARRLGVAPIPALAASAAFALSGIASSETEVQNVLCDRFVPWVLWAALVARDRPALRGVVPLAALESLMFFGGEPSLWAATHVLAMAVLLWPPGGRRRLGKALAGNALWLVLSAGQLVPMVAYVAATERWEGLGAADVAQWSLRPIELLELAIPGVLDAGFPGKHRGAQTYLATVYLGATCLTLVLARAAGARWRRCEVAIALLGLLFLLGALGDSTPLHGVYRLLTAGLVRYPVRLMTFVSLALALLAAFALEGLLAGQGRRPMALLALATAAQPAIGLLGAWLAPETAALAGAARGTALSAALILASLLAPARGAALAIAIISADLLTAPPEGHLLTVPAAAVERPSCAAPWLAELQDGRYRALPLLAPPGVLQRVLAAPPEEQPATLVRAPFGLALVPCRARSAAPEPVLPLREWTAWLQAHPLRAARASVRVLLTDGPGGAVRAVRVPGRPRISWARRVVPDPGGPEAAALLGELPVDHVLVPSRRADDPGSGDIAVDEDGAHRIRLRVAPDRDALLVLTERWEKAWRATVDGAPVPVHRCDGMFLGVEVPAGRHDVALSYRDGRGEAALLLSAGAWLVLLLAAVRRLSSAGP